MAQSSTLATLIDLAEQASDEAAAKLGSAIRATQDLESKLGLLKKYRDDYTQKLQAEMKAGRDMQHIRNFQTFIGKIDDAIRGQQQLVLDAQKQVQIEKKHWQDEERKRKSFTTLEERAEKAQQKKEARQDQLQTDEIGTRNTFYKQPN